MNTRLLTELIQKLEFVIMEQVSEDRFQIVGEPPAWFLRLFPDALKDERGIKPSRKFPFLANFLIDAEDFWIRGSGERLKSGSWIESDKAGKQYQIEATALALGDRNLLLLESGQYSYKEKQFILEKGRDLNFDYKLLEAFEKEQLRYQRDFEEEMKLRTAGLQEEIARLQARVKELEAQTG